MLRISQKDVSNVAYVIKALSKDKTKRSLQYLSIEPDGEVSRIVATDGHRLHYTTTCEVYIPGIYKVMKKSAKEIVLEPMSNVENFPAYRQVIPKESDLNQCATSSDGIMSAYAKVIRALEPPITIDFNYFKDAYTLLDVYVTPTNPSGPIVLKGGSLLSLIMPMRS